MSIIITDLQSYEEHKKNRKVPEKKGYLVFKEHNYYFSTKPVTKEVFRFTDDELKEVYGEKTNKSNFIQSTKELLIYDFKKGKLLSPKKDFEKNKPIPCILLTNKYEEEKKRQVGLSSTFAFIKIIITLIILYFLSLFPSGGFTKFGISMITGLSGVIFFVSIFVIILTGILAFYFKYMDKLLIQKIISLFE